MSPDPPRRAYKHGAVRVVRTGPLGGNIQNPQSLNRYAYVLNNPESLVDPWGLCVVGTPPPDSASYSAGAHGTTVRVVGYTVRSPDVARLEWDGSPFPGPLAPPPDTVIYHVRLPGNLPTPRSQSPQRQKGCQVGPLNLTTDIQTAKQLAGQFWSGLLEGGQGGSGQAGVASALYLGLVQTGGPWDPKDTLGSTPENVAAGNINFGATCSQFGFNTWIGGQICQFGAGIAGKLSGNYGSPLFSRYHGDWPQDNTQIRQGIAIAERGGC